MILDPGFNLTLRPMKYPVFFEMYKAAIKNTWTVEEVDFSTDLTDLQARVHPAERHLIQRLVAFFGKDRRLSDVSPGDTDRFADWGRLDRAIKALARPSRLTSR